MLGLLILPALAGPVRFEGDSGEEESGGERGAGLETDPLSDIA